ncbi:hypothetical protein B566_EDAN011351, partial [Ephemera danica]
MTFGYQPTANYMAGLIEEEDVQRPTRDNPEVQHHLMDWRTIPEAGNHLVNRTSVVWHTSWKPCHSLHPSIPVLQSLLFDVANEEANLMEPIHRRANTRCSQAVTHPSTDRAQRCLTSVIGREP